MANTKGRPFDDMLSLISTMPDPDVAAQSAVREILSAYEGKPDPLGRLSDHLVWLAGWQKRPRPHIARPLMAIFAGTHAVAKSYSDVSLEALAHKRVKEMSEGAAGVRGVAAGQNMAYKVYEMGLDYPADNFLEKPSLSERDTAAAMAFGMEVVAEGADIIGLGNAGYGSATCAAAIALGLYGGSASYWANGSDLQAAKRIEIVEEAYKKHRSEMNGPLDILRYFGGRDIAGIVGAIIAARHQSIPIVLDGFVVTAAAAILHEIDPKAVDHCIAGHISSEPAHGALLDRMGKNPVIDFGLGRGDGFGAAMAIGMLKMGAQAYETLAIG